MNVYTLSLPGNLPDGTEVELQGFASSFTVTRFAPSVSIAPSSTATFRLQDEPGAAPANFIEATIDAGETLAEPVVGSLEIAPGASLYLRVVTGGGAEFLGGHFEYLWFGQPGASLLTTVSCVKAFRGISGVLSDSLIEFLVAGVSTRMARYMEREIGPHTVLAEKHSGDGWSEVLQLRDYPVRSVQEIREDAVVVAASEYVIDERLGQVITKGRRTWVKGRLNLEADYEAGFLSIPDDLKLYATIQVVRTLQDAGKDGRLGELGTVLDAAGSSQYVVGPWYPGVREAMLPYRRAV